MAKLVKFSTGTGVSLQVKDVWYKFNCEIELELQEGDDIPTVKKKAWDTVTKEVEKQVTVILKG